MEIAVQTIEKAEMPWGETYENVRVEYNSFGIGAGIAIQLFSEQGELLSTPAVNLMEYGMIPPTPWHMFIKDYSEGEGMTDLLVKHNIVERTGTVVEFGPFDAKANLVRIK